LGGDEVEEEVDYDDDEEDDEELEEVDQGAYDKANAKTRRSINYSVIEDTVLCKAWSHVSLDAINGTDQTGKRYWIRIEDMFFKLLPPVENPMERTYLSLQGRWDVIKSSCSRWNGAL
jgi:hypothetical protein